MRGESYVVGMGRGGVTFRGGIFGWHLLFFCRRPECLVTEDQGIHSVNENNFLSLTLASP